MNLHLFLKEINLLLSKTHKFIFLRVFGITQDSFHQGVRNIFHKIIEEDAVIFVSRYVLVMLFLRLRNTEDR